MKKIVVTILSIIMGLTLFVGCTGKSGKSNGEKNVDNSWKNVKESGKILVGLDDGYPPMEFRDEKNNLVGFDIDLANEIGKKLDVKVEFVTSEWSGIFLAFQSKKFDVMISGLSITEKRKKTMDFSEPYIFGGQVIAVKKGNESIKKLSDLKGKVIGCQMGSTGQKSAEENLKEIKDLKKYGKITEAYSELAIGRIDGVIMDAQVGQYYSFKKPDDFVVLDEMVSKEPVGVGFRKGDKELNVQIQKAINELKNDGTLSKISIKWFGKDVYKNLK